MTRIALSLPPLAEINREIERRRLLRSHLEFTRRFFEESQGQEFSAAPFHDVICRTLDAVFLGDIRRLIINIPPGYGKTELAVINFMARGLALNPAARFIHASYAQQLALDNSSKVRDLINLEGFQSLWNVSLRADTAAKGLWRTTQGGHVRAAASGEPITGFRAGRLRGDGEDWKFTGALIIDDPIKPDDVSSDPTRKFINARWQNTFRSRLGDESVPVIVIMQRLHVDDFTAHLLATSGERWHVLKLPIEIDGECSFAPAGAEMIPHGLPNGPLWSKKHSPADIDLLRLSPLEFAGQYMQEPISSGGNLFKSEWLAEHDAPPKLRWRAIYADTAQKTRERNDYSVFQHWGAGLDGKAYLLDLVRGRFEAPELEQTALAFWKKAMTWDRDLYGPLRKMAIEDKASGTGLIQAVRRQAIPIVAIPRDRDKYTRALDVLPSMAAGLVSIPKGAPWKRDFVSELLAFPDGTFDDQVDPLMDAVSDICGLGRQPPVAATGATRRTDMDKSQDPSTPSLAYEALSDDWAMIRAILAGAKAVKAAGEKYLTKYPAESADEYERRKKSAPWRPEFKDALRGLSSKPFAKEVSLAGNPSEEMKSLAEDIDGRGNNLHNFAKGAFEGAVALGAHGILVDFPPVEGAKTRAEERAAGVRPYWVSINADDILSLQTSQVGGKRIVSYLRLKETSVERDGFAEKRVEKIREIVPGEWRTWRKSVNAAGGVEWIADASGAMSLSQVPFVFLATDEVQGDQFVRPPLIDLAGIQIELYQAGSNKEQIFTVAGSPMLSADGMAAPNDGSPVETGPGRVLYAPAMEGVTTGWKYIQPVAANLKEIRDDISEIISDIRRLAMQPMLPRTGTVTATASGIEAAKAHSALQAWALALKDALEQAFVFTAMWLKAPETAPEVQVHTDFAVGLYGADEVKVLLEARKEAQISQETLWDEYQRRGVLGPQFDPAVERARLDKESPPFDPEGTLETDETTSPPAIQPAATEA